jgi:hypothetical protein
MGTRAGLDAVVKRKIPSPCRNSNPRIQPVARRCTTELCRLQTCFLSFSNSSMFLDFLESFPLLFYVTYNPVDVIRNLIMTILSRYDMLHMFHTYLLMPCTYSETATLYTPPHFDRFWRPERPDIQRVTGDLSPGVKVPEREADHSTSASIFIKNTYNFISISPTRLHGLILRHRDFYIHNYTF